MGTRAALTSLAAVAALAALAAACQGRGRDRDGARVEPPAADADGSGAGSAEPDAGGGSGTGSGAGSGAGSAGATAEDPDAPADPSKQIAELGAISAWQAVIDRAQLLARRGQKGVVFGRVGPAILAPAPAPATPPGAADAGAPPPAPPPPPDAGLVPSPYVWLVDDTEGNGSLGIRIALGKHAASAKEGDRIAASGAWELDEERRWFWRANALQPLAAPPAPAAGSGSAGRPAADAPPAVPGHVPPTGPFPPGVKPIKQAKDGDLVYFQLVGPYPARPGDGWLVASELGDIPVALLILPGERSSYGGMDMRTPDEHWQLRRQQTYWVRLGRIRSQGPGKPFVVQARTGPVRVQ